MDFAITGGTQLSGTIETNASKNGALGLLCASLINRAPTTLHGIPRIEEVYRLLEILTSIGVKATWTNDNTVRIEPPANFNLDGLNLQAASKIRAVIMLIGALVHHSPSFRIPHAGGCKMGQRTIAAHRYGLEKLGVHITTEDEYYLIERGRFTPNTVVLYESSDTAVENLLIAASCIPGTTVLKFAPPNYQVQEVCFFLETLGVKIEGIGTTTLTIHGLSRIEKEITYHNSEDPIESMMFISAAVTTHSQLTVTRCPIDFLEVEMLKLEKMGLTYDRSAVYTSNNGRTQLVDFTVYPSELHALTDKIHAQPYPGINTDNLPFFVPIATQAKGSTLIHDWMWENRAIYFTEFNHLGAHVTLADPHRVFIQGPTPLRAAEIVCPPALRPAMIILIGMLAAKGQSMLKNVYSINRGYEEIATRLNTIGAHVEIKKEHTP